ncbi:MAG: hypothetical protein AABW68_01470 [archaeon]
MWVDLLFPGIWVHELAHAIGCVLGGVPIHHIEMRSRSGKVVHSASTLRNSTLISLAPLIAGSALSFFLFDQAFLQRNEGLLWAFVMGWLAFSIGFHSIPSLADMSNVADTIPRRIQEWWSSPSGLAAKILMSGWYLLVWPIAWVGAGVSWLMEQTLWSRVGWALFLGWIAYP